jgi:2-iminobutanoate/2-iminopropanoate deaminase
VWDRDVPPPAITVQIVSGLGPVGAVVEIEAIAALADSSPARARVDRP